MKVGILNAIPAGDGRVDWGGTPVDGYIRFFKSLGAPFEFSGFHVAQGEFPDSPDTCDAYIVTSSPRGTYDEDPWIAKLAQFIRDAYQAGKKVVGICFGHQIVAQALGGLSIKSEKGWGYGLKDFNIFQSKPWMNGETNQCSLYFAHQDQVVLLPPGAELLAGSDFCPNAMFQLEDRALGIQGHPEFTDSIMRGLLNGSEEKLGEKVHETAVASLDSGTPDNQMVGHWIINFLNGEKRV